ncbi:MAG: hypothetical protein ACREN4_05390 [Candidatus Dormibacteria bacterium]
MRQTKILPAAVAGLLLLALALASEAPTRNPGSATSPVRLGGGGRAVTVSTPTYRLRLGGRSALLQVWLRGDSFTVPALALLGRSRLPRHLHFRARAQGRTVVLQTYRQDGQLLEQTRIRPEARFFTVQFSGRIGPHRQAPAIFFSDGNRGLPAQLLRYGFAPNPLGRPYASSLLTQLGSLPPFHTAPFAPPPLDVELRTATGWIGIGLAQVPDATRLDLTTSGGVAVNYPLALLARLPDRGPGGFVKSPAGSRGRSAWLRLPAFVITLAGNVLAGLTRYHAALGQLGLAPLARPRDGRPRWWSWPLVDTWGQQRVSGAADSSRRYTASWVRHFASAVRRRFGVRHFTLVVDAQWQRHLGGATPSARFGGVVGMHRLIRQLHQMGLRVVLWWPLWVRQRDGQRVRVDPTTTGFPTATRTAMRLLLGRGRHQLGADGLKLDWGYLVPDPGHSHFSRPALGVGSAALLRYMTILSQGAWKADPGALVDASAVAPQFGGTEDEIRLYDARRASTWDWRATLVSAVDPGFPIDGDGWRLDATQAVRHIVSSAVYGVPALYYSTRWSGGEPIPNRLARELGAVLRAATLRGPGDAVPRRDGGWAFYRRGRLAAETLDGDRGLAVFQPRRGQSEQVTLVSVGPEWLRVSLPPGTILGRVRPPRGGAASTTGDGPSLVIRLEPGVTYRAFLRLLPRTVARDQHPSAAAAAAF